MDTERLRKIYLAQANASAPYTGVSGVGYSGGGIVSLQPPGVNYPTGKPEHTKQVKKIMKIIPETYVTEPSKRKSTIIPKKIPGDYSAYTRQKILEGLAKNADNFVPIAPGVETVIDQADFLAEQQRINDPEAPPFNVIANKGAGLYFNKKQASAKARRIATVPDNKDAERYRAIIQQLQTHRKNKPERGYVNDTHKSLQNSIDFARELAYYDKLEREKSLLEERARQHKIFN
jgi:hypothetical protein